MTARQPADRASDWTDYLALAGSHAALFGMLGPLVGAIASPGIIFLPLAVIAAYQISFLSAVATGALVGLAAPVLKRPHHLNLLGAAAGAICAVIFPFGVAALHSAIVAPPLMLATYAFSGSVAGLACTALSRSIRQRWLPA